MINKHIQGVKIKFTNTKQIFDNCSCPENITEAQRPWNIYDTFQIKKIKNVKII